MNTRHRRTAFSVVELLVVLGILVILLSIFIPYLLSLRETDRRTRCAYNLRTIKAGLDAYAQDNGYSYPRVRYDAEGNPNGWTAYTGPDASDPFAADSAVQPNDVTASLWLLLRGGYVKETSAFICPSSGDRPDGLLDRSGRRVKVTDRGNFRSAAHLSYSYSSPFSSAASYEMSDTRPAEFVIMADMNPGIVGDDDAVTEASIDAPPLELARANSNNHGEAGQNVLFATGHVEFRRTPYCGYGRDNIYTALSEKPLVTTRDERPATVNGVIGPDIGPAWEYDSYLVPTDDEGP